MGLEVKEIGFARRQASHMIRQKRICSHDTLCDLMNCLLKPQACTGSFFAKTYTSTAVMTSRKPWRLDDSIMETCEEFVDQIK